MAPTRRDISDDDDDGGGGGGGGGPPLNRDWTSIPRPDPTVLTTEIVNQAKADLRRESAALRELIEARVTALEGVVGSLGIAVEKMPNAAAHAALGEQIRTIGGQIDRLFQLRDTGRNEAIEYATTTVERLKDLHEERFTAIQQQFSERDVRGEQEKKASKEALDAALLAQKESVSQQNDANTTAATKSETSFTKQIDQIGTLIATLEKSLTDRITELKERIDRGEGGVAGKVEQVHEQRYERDQRRLSQGQWIGALAVVFAAVTATAYLIALLVH